MFDTWFIAVQILWTDSFQAMSFLGSRDFTPIHIESVNKASFVRTARHHIGESLSASCSMPVNCVASCLRGEVLGLQEQNTVCGYCCTENFDVCLALHACGHVADVEMQACAVAWLCWEAGLSNT